MAILKMAILKKTFSCVLIFSLASLCLPAGESLIIIDKSWSMKGFFYTGAVKTIYTGLEKELENTTLFSPVKLFAFSTEGLREYNRFNDIKPAGDTLIDRALEEAVDLKPGVIILITDNIQDPGGINADTDVTQFYSLLKQEIVEWVFIFPLKLPFRGWVYGNKDWRGQRAAIMYALLLKKENILVSEQEKREKEFLNLVGAIEQAVGTARIRCKPLEKGVTMSVREFKPGTGNVDITTAGVKVQYKRFTPVPVFHVKLKIHSKYSNIVVRKAKIEGWTPGRIRKNGFIHDLHANRLKVIVRPDYLDNLKPLATDDRYRVEMRYDGLTPDKSLFSILKMPFSKDIEIDGDVQLIIRIPNTDFQLLPSILDSYGTGKKEDPARIYGLEQLVPMLSEGEEVHIKKKVKFNIVMPHPGWAVWVLLGLLLLVISPVVLGYIGYKQAKHLFRVKVNEKETGRTRIFPMIWTPLRAQEHGKMCRVKKKGSFILVKPTAGFSWRTEHDTTCRGFDLNDTVLITLLDEQMQVVYIELTADKSIDNLNDKEGGYADNQHRYFEDENENENKKESFFD